GRKAQKDLWESNRSAWTQKITATGRNIELILWNSSMLFNKLSESHLKGTFDLFFGKTPVDEQQMFIQLDAAIQSLGPKYSATLNLQIHGMSYPFDALARNRRFKEDFKKRCDELLTKWRKTENDASHIEKLKQFAQQLTNKRLAFEKLFGSVDLESMAAIPVEQFNKILSLVQNELTQVNSIYRELEDEYRKKLEAEKAQKQVTEKKEKQTYQPPSPDRLYRSERDHLHELQRELMNYEDYLAGAAVTASNEGNLLLRGDWGLGKSHLLADIALENKSLNIPSVFLLGMQFPEQPPRTTIQQMLCPNEKLENYLAALNALGKAKQQRILFIIDAINEGKGKYIWKDSIAGIVHEFKQYEWVALVVSYRTTYEKVVLPEGFKQPTVTHHGFEGLEDTAAREFFNFYKLEQTIPLFNPEFSIPLFLKIFCQTMVNLGYKKIDHGFSGITNIFESFTASINQKLGERLDYPWERVNPVQKTIDALVAVQMESGQYVLEYNKAHAIAEAAASPYTNHKNFLEELLKENLLMEDYLFDNTQSSYSRNGISFSYERMIDQFKARHVIRNKTLPQLRKSFAKGGELQKQLLKPHYYEGMNNGVLDALAILLPEVFGIELNEVVPNNMANQLEGAVYNAILGSLLWRKSSTTNEKLWEYIKAHLNTSERASEKFFEIILLVCTHKGHYFNSDFLHRQLMDRTVAERDKIWTIPISRIYRYYDPSSVERIINWCWNDHIDDYPMDDETVVHIGTVLSWLFTSSDRFIRDKASKAFTALFVHRVHLLKVVFDKIQDVNDPYVLERVVAGCFGAVSRSNDHNAIREFVQYVYDLYFRTSKPPVNILTRDYAKCMVECAVGKGIKLDYKPALLNPPFKSVFPKKIPTIEWADALEHRKKSGEKYTDEERGYFQIITSLRGFGDFSRYILGTNHRDSGSFAAYKIDSKKAYESLQKKLRGNKKNFFEIYCSSQNYLAKKGSLGQSLHSIVDEEKRESLLANTMEFAERTEEFLKKHCTPEQLKLFRKSKEYIQNGLPFEKGRDLPRFDLDKVARWILYRVFDLGWTKEDFGLHDSSLDSQGRDVGKAERIGKKYQWIAYYEIMALLTDHYEYIGRYNYSDIPEPYVGAFQEHVRNFDPTVLYKAKKKRDEDGHKSRSDIQENWWWQARYSNWSEDRKDWLAKDNDIPEITKFIHLTHPLTREQWCMMDGMFVFEQDKQLGLDKFSTHRRELWLQFKTLLVLKKDLSRIMEGGKKKLHWLRDQVPDNFSYYGIYHGELYEADGYKKSGRAEENPLYPFTDITVDGKKYDAIELVEEMSVGGEYDCSGETVRLHKPCGTLFHLLDARFGKNDALLYNAAGEIIGMDTGAYYEEEHSCFLLQKKALEKLKDSDLALVWYYFGEKEDIGPGASFVYRRLFSGFVTKEKEDWRISHFGTIERSR
ncbi:MAG: hypothetical protein FD136_1208, partial [Chitinophagaceae bacterium]